MDASGIRIGVVIPCYRVAHHIEDVLHRIPEFVHTVVCVNDASPDDGSVRIALLKDPRVVLVEHTSNQGVGGAMVTGYQECLRRGMDIVVKIDGDGQMDPADAALLIGPIVRGDADYTKGNRWTHAVELAAMPYTRRLGSLALSFATKLSSGYWNIFDPCNGYTAISAAALKRLPVQRIARDYFFESSMLIELNVLRAVVEDVPLPSRYGTEQSSMRISRILRRFPVSLARSLIYRVWQRHFVRDFGPIGAYLTLGLPLLLWGVGFGGLQWLRSWTSGEPQSAGTVMLAALPFLLGFQLLLQASLLEMTDRPAKPLCREQWDEDAGKTVIGTLRKVA